MLFSVVIACAVLATSSAYNVKGVFHCQPGFYHYYEVYGNDYVGSCADINECETTMPCDQVCTNTNGNYSCSCAPGFHVDPTNRTKCEADKTECNPGSKPGPNGCVDINECETTSPCDQTCHNLQPGTYRCSCRAGYEVNQNNNNTCDEIQICDALADIIIVLHSSDSVGADNYKLQLAFISRVVRHFSLGTNKTKFCALLFSNVVQKLFDLKNNYTTRDEVAEAIRQAPYLQGTSETNDAFSYIRKNSLFKPFSGGRSKAPQIIIVFTNGQSTYSDASLNLANRLKKENVKIITVGIGEVVSLEKLGQVASSKDDVFGASSFQMLDYIEQKLSKRVCLSAS